MRSKSKTKEQRHPLSQVDNTQKRDQLTFILLIIGVIISAVGLLFPYLSYKNSISQAKLEDLNIEIVHPNDEQKSNILFITAEISNLGQNAITIIEPDIKITYENRKPPVYSTLTQTLLGTSLQTPTNQFDGNEILVREFPGLSDQEDLLEALCIVRKLAFVPLGTSTITPIPTTSNSVDNNTVCFGIDDCHSISVKNLPSVLIFSGNKQEVITKLLSTNISTDDLPIIISPGETKRVFLAWNIDFNCSTKVRLKTLIIFLNFNNRQTLQINVIDNLEIAQ
jgi:hypothetical protein